MAARNYCFDVRAAQAHFPGVGRYARNLASALPAALAPDERLTLLRDPAHAAADLPVADERVQVIDAPFSHFAPAQQWRMPALLRRAGASLYHSPYYLMPLRPGVPAVVSLHDLIPLHYPQYHGAAARLAFAVSVRLAVRAAQTVLAPSATIAADIRERLGVPAQRLAVVPYAADAIFRPQPPGTVAAMRARLGVPDDYVLCVGANRPHKNLVRLIEAWARLQPQPRPLVIAGPWDARYPEARARAAALGLGDAVRFLGAVSEDDLPALYSGAKLFVFPSEYEGFGFPALEAMACGTPVACAAGGSLPEVVGVAARLFPPHDVDAISESIDALLRNATARADLARRGTARAATFTWARTAQQTLEVYRAVAF